MCMQRQGQVKLFSFDPELERNPNRLRREQREAQMRNQGVMQNQEEKD